MISIIYILLEFIAICIERAYKIVNNVAYSLYSSKVIKTQI